MNLYLETCKRLTRGRKERMTDAEIIEELAEEIIFYRNKIITLQSALAEKEEHSLEEMKAQGTE